MPHALTDRGVHRTPPAGRRPLSRPPSRLAAEAGFLAAAGALLMLHAGRAFEGLHVSGAWWALPLAILAGYLAADLATGLVHWFGDRFFAEDTPILGDALIRPFREHHDNPRDLVEHGLLELHGNSAIPVVALLGPLWWVPLPVGALTGAFEAWLVVFAATAMAANQFHMWAHAPSVPPAVRWLQRRGVILSPERHARHHRGGFDRSFCISSGVLNPWLDRIDFFGRLERAIRAVAPARPR